MQIELIMSMKSLLLNSTTHNPCIVVNNNTAFVQLCKRESYNMKPHAPTNLHQQKHVLFVSCILAFKCL